MKIRPFAFNDFYIAMGNTHRENGGQKHISNTHGL